MGLNSANCVLQDFAKQSDVLLYVDMKINDGTSCFNYYGNVWIPNKICFDTLADKKSTCNVRKASRFAGDLGSHSTSAICFPFLVFSKFSYSYVMLL